MNNRKNILLGAASVFLFLALINGLPYGFFTMLRFVVCLSSLYVAWQAYGQNKIYWAISLGFIGILFNPFIPIHLDREIWVYLDAIVGVFMITSMKMLQLKN
jgi:hypothetical protein